MNILLRKHKGQFVPFFGSTAARSFGTGAPAGSVTRFLNSGFLFAVIAIAFIVAAAIAGLFHPPALLAAAPMTKLGLAPVLGSITAKSLREKRATLGEQANAILTDAGKENRDLSTEDQQKFDRLHDEIERLGKDIERVERQERHNAEMAETRGTVAGRQDTNRETADTKTEEQKRHAEAFKAYLRNGMEGLTPEQRSIMQARFEPGDSRAAQTVTTSGGGYLIPQGFVNELEKNMQAYGGVENVADVIRTDSGNPLPWPTVDDTQNTGRLLAINTQATQTGVTYGVKTFGAYKFSSDVVLVPVELMQDSAFDLDAHLNSVLAERLGRVHNTYQTTGTGSSQPQGIVVGSSNGVTAAGTSTVTFEEILDLVHSIDPAYRSQPGAGFMFNDGTLKILRKLKDAEGRPLWQAGIAGGAPNTLFDFPYTINQDMAAMTTGNKPILFGAMKKFKVRKVKDVTLLRLVERYADYHQIGFLAFTRMDSLLLDSGTNDPIKYITMA